MKLAILNAVLFAWLWPFGGDKPKDTDDPNATIRDLEGHEVEIDRNVPIDQGAEQAMEGYRAFLELAIDDPALRAEAMRRLADLQLEAGEDQQMEGLGETVATEYEEAVLLYQQLLMAYPENAQNDRVMYQLARAYENNGQTERALEVLDRLVRQHPDTDYIDEAQFRRGEILFLSKSYVASEEAYRVVLAVGDESEFYEESLYKHGWALFKQLRHEECIVSFAEILDRKLITTDGSIVELEKLSRAEREMIDDTFRVISISFSYMEGAESVEEYLATRGDVAYDYLLYVRLGQLFLDKERYQDAADTYKGFVERQPNHDQAPLMQVRVIDAYRLARFPSMVLEEKQALIDSYGPTSSYWELHDPEDMPDEFMPHIKANLMDLAKHYHSMAQQTKKTEHLDRAARYYRDYIDSFPDDPDTARNNFLLAEILFDSGRYKEAVVEYERTAYGYPFHGQADEAGYAALLSYARQEEQLPEVDRAAWHRRSIDSSLRFAATYPRHEQVATVLTKAAEDLFELDEYGEAIQVSSKVIAIEPAVDLKLRQTSWTVLAHSLLDLNDYVQAEGAYLALRTLMPVNDPRQTDITERIAASAYKQGELAREVGDLSASVTHFSRVGQLAPTSGIRATADYDAAAALVALEDWGRAAQALEHFRSTHPANELNKDVTQALAAAYLESGNSVGAAGEFERIAMESSDNPDVQREAMWKAADLYDKANQTAAATVAYERFVGRFPYPLDEAMNARERLLKLAKRSNNQTLYFRRLHEIISADELAGSTRTARSRTLAARASLEMAQPKLNTFLNLRLIAPLQDSLRLKKVAMESALEAYGKSASYEIAEVTTASTYHIAEIYNGMSRALFDSERPPKLSPEELEQYEILLEEQAFPFEEKAIEIHEANALRASEGVYDEWVAASYEQLAKLLPIRYAKAEKGTDYATAIQ